MLTQITFLYTTTIFQTKKFSEMSSIFYASLHIFSVWFNGIELYFISAPTFNLLQYRIKFSLWKSGKLYTQEKITVKKADDV